MAIILFNPLKFLIVLFPANFLDYGITPSDKINSFEHTGMTSQASSVTSHEGKYIDVIPAYNGAVTPEIIEKYHGEDKARLFENDLAAYVADHNNVAVDKIVTDKNGYAQTAADALPYGTYLIVETEPSTGYMLPRKWYRIVDVTSEHLYTWDEMNLEYTLGNVKTKQTLEPVVRGDVQIMKFDQDLNVPHAEADNALEGIEYKIYNVSDSYTYLWELTNYRTDPLVDTSSAEYNTPAKIVNRTAMMTKMIADLSSRTALILSISVRE